MRTLLVRIRGFLGEEERRFFRNARSIFSSEFSLRSRANSTRSLARPSPWTPDDATPDLIDSVSHGVPAALSEVITLGRTLKQWAADVLAYFDRPGTSNGPTEAILGRLEHLRGSALGFWNLTNYIARSLLEAGGFRPRLHPRS